MRQFRTGFAQASALIVSALPTIALADELLTPARIFGDAAPLQKVIILALFVAILSAFGVAAARLVKGPAHRWGAGFVSSLRLGGPLLGLLGATYSTLNGFVGLANVPVTPPLRVIAPGVAESLFVLGLGILAAVAAVFAHWAMEAKSAPPA